jgi:RNA polymerase sigma-70 factor (ECF subfamily)
MNGHMAEAEDALSQVMLKALDRLPACAQRVLCPEAWLHRLARNLCIDLRRERQRRSEISENWKILATLAEANASPSDIAVETESHQRIAALPPRLRESFELHIVQETPVKKVATQLGLSSANVRKRVQLARAWLRRDRVGPPERNGGSGPTKLEPPQPTPAMRPRGQSNRGELIASAAVLLTAHVKLSCGVEQLFHVFPARAPVSPGRKIKSLHRLLRQHPDNWGKRLELAGLFHLTGAWAEAVGEWQQLLAIRPHLPAALKLGDTLLKLGAAEAAAAVFKHAWQPDYQATATGRHLDGWIAFCEKDAGRSVREFQAAADLEPENPAHWHGLALAQRRAGATPAALTALQRALGLNPNDLVALSLSHEMLLAAGAVEEAVRRAEQVLILAPGDLLTLRRLVECRCQLGLTQGAVGMETKRLLRRTSRLARNPLSLREPLAAFFLARGEPKKALAVQCEFIEQHPQCPRGRQTYLRLLAATGRPDHLPAVSRVWKLPSAKCCNGACRALE